METSQVGVSERGRLHFVDDTDDCVFICGVTHQRAGRETLFPTFLIDFNNTAMVKAEISEDITYENFVVHGARHISNTGGIELMVNRSNDGVYFRYNYGQDLTKEPIYEAELVDDQDGEFYFYDNNGEVEYLNNYLRV
jgi:hypothetical protein